MMNDIELRNKIMRRVWMIYMVRQVSHPVLRAGALLALALALVSSVSIKNVIANALGTSGPIGLARFSLSALENTTLSVQILSVLATGLVVWFIVDTVRTSVLTRQVRLGA